MNTETRTEQFNETDYDESLHHVALGPPFITTLCGVNIRGQQPTEAQRRPGCPICEALEKGYLENR